MSSPITIGILGATGMVGQRMIERLNQHPWFQIGFLAASPRSAGKVYAQATNWRLAGDVPDAVANMMVHPCEPSKCPAGIRIVLSALDTNAARSIEAQFRDAGYFVVSNASAHRMDPNVPLIVPEINADHLSLLEQQPGPGGIIANPNCCAIPLALALAPLHRRWGVEAVTVATWQAVSGAGYPGESAWDMVGSVHPHPGQEEEKLTVEPHKILGSPQQAARFVTSARCVRVPVADGHLLGIHLRLSGQPTVDAVAEALQTWMGNDPSLSLPSCPQPPLRLVSRRDRPATRFDVHAGDGMAVTIGRLESCPVLGVKFYALSHNTIRGAAGAAIANAELLVRRNLL